MTHPAKKSSPGDSQQAKDFYYLPPTQCVTVYVLCVQQVARYVWNRTDFNAVDPETTDYLMGEFLFCPPMLFFPVER